MSFSFSCFLLTSSLPAEEMISVASTNVLCELMLSLNAGETANWIMLNLINASEFRKLHEV